MKRPLRWLRDIAPVVVLVVLALAGAGFAWLTAHPETPWLEEAETWPAVGGLATKFRNAYLGSGASEAADRDESELAASEGREGGTGEGEEEPLRIAQTPAPRGRAQEKTSAPRAPRLAPSKRGPAAGAKKPSRIPEVSDPRSTRGHPRSGGAPTPVAFVALEWRWFLPGHGLRSAAGTEAEETGTLGAMAYLPIVDTEGPFAQVVYRGQRTWLDTLWQPPFSRKKARRGLARARAEPVTASDTTRLRKAQNILGLDRKAPTEKLGAYSLYTDVEDQELLAFLDSAAREAEDAYFARYGRLPSGDPKRSVVLFARKAGYQEYSEDYGPDADRFVGHASQGLSTFFVENRSREELARTLVHEITHLLNGRAIAHRLPSWLEEGIASDLGSVWVEASGAVSRGGGAFEDQGWISQGPGQRFVYLAGMAEAGTLPSLAVLMGLDREKFYSEALSSFSYSCSLATIRFFLDADGGRRADLFREWLRRIAIGRGADPRQLAQDTDGGFEQLDANFRVWVRGQAALHRQSLRDQAWANNAGR